MNQKTTFQIIYDGPALHMHEMDIRDLAPALLAVSDIFEEANKILNADNTKVQVKVQGSFKTGSFGIDLSVIKVPISDILSLFNSDNANAAANLLGMIGFSIPGGGLIGFLAWLRNRQIKKIHEENDTTTVVEVIDGEKYTTHPKIIALFSSVRVRTSIQKVIVEPLSREGIESFTVKSGSEKVTVNKENKDDFKLTEVPDELLKDQEREVFLKLMTIAFAEGYKWKFSDGNVEFFATISDDVFVAKVQQNKDGFFKDDLLKVLLREKQWIANTGIKSEYEVVKVIEHRSGAKQIRLPF